MAASAALVKPQTKRSLGGPVLIYVLWSECTLSIGVIQCAVSESQFSQTASTIIASHVASFGSWIWFGVVLHLIASFLGLCVTRQPFSGEVLTLNRLLVATSLSAAGFAMQRFGRIEQIWVMPDEAQLVFMMGTALPVAVWSIVLWTQICSYRAALFLIVITIIGGICMSEFLHAAVWSKVELKDVNAKIGQLPLSASHSWSNSASAVTTSVWLIFCDRSVTSSSSITVEHEHSTSVLQDFLEADTNFALQGLSIAG